MGAALSLADALGVDMRAAAEFLPPVEAVMARETNKAIRERGE